MKRTAILSLLVLLLCAAVSAQAGTAGRGKIRGTVLDDKTGQPIEGVTVRLFSVKAQASFQPAPKTDAAGVWKAIYLRSGMWNIDFEKAGYETRKLSYRIDETPGAKQPDIEVRLTRIEGLALTDDVLSELDKGNQLFAAKQYAAAIAEFEELLKKFPDVFIVNKNIGNCYFAMEKYDLAVAAYLKVVARQPGGTDTMVLIGNAYNNAGDNVKAMEWYAKVPLAEIKDIDTLYNIGVNLYNAGRNEPARGYFRRAVEIDPEFADGYYQLGMVAAALNDVPGAIQALNRFIELAPDSPNLATAKAIVDAFSTVK